MPNASNTPPVRLETRDLRLVTAITECGSLTKAGQQLHLTQSALSHQLADLERRLGGKLFERSGRRLIATRLGEHFSANARPTLHQLQELERHLVQMANGREATLRLATECYTCYHWLPPVLGAFRRQHSAVEVRIVPDATPRPFAALLNGEVDLCIVNSPRRNRRIRTTPLFEDELVLVASTDNPLAERKVIEPVDLRDQSFLMYSPPEHNFAFRDILAPAGVSPSQLSSLKLTEAIIELVRANTGVSLLARWAIAPYLDSGTLVARPINHPAARRSWQAATCAARPLSEVLSDFILFLKRSISAPPRGKPEFSTIRTMREAGRRGFNR
jgi:LysR family transcriptional regulator, regulator for metE and metH